MFKCGFRLQKYEEFTVLALCIYASLLLLKANVVVMPYAGALVHMTRVPCTASSPVRE